MSKKKRKHQKRRVPPQLPNAKKARIPPRFGVGVAVGLCVAVALCLRICLPYDDIFTGGWVKFASNDAYYYMRLVDNMAHNFPHLMAFDSYLVYPDGQPILSFYLFARLLAGTSWLVGMGHPTQHIVDAVCVFAPAVMGALVVIPVYFIGKALWGRLAGVISAALIAVLPGEFLGRSMLGFADHHVAEVLFSAVSLMFLIMALKAGSQKLLGLDSLKSRDGIKPIVYSLLAGVFFGLYGLTWQGGSLLRFIVFSYFIVQFVIDHLRYRSVFYLCIVGFVFNLVAVVVFLPSIVQAYNLSFYLASMGGALLLPLMLGGLSWLMKGKKFRRVYYPLGILCFGLLGMLVFKVVSPSLFGEVWGILTFVFLPSGTQLTTIEMQSLLFPNGTFTLSIVWGNFGLAIFVALVSLVVLICSMVKRGDADKSLLVVWTVVVMAMALGQRRFAYYLAVNVALLAGYLSYRVLECAGLKEWQDAMGRIKSKKGRSVFAHGLTLALVGVVIVVVVFLPVIPGAVSTAGKARYAPSDAWCESLDWMRENTPEPFPDKANHAYQALKIEDKAEYSVLAWWDYGYWITRIAHRIPNVNPGQDPIVQSKVANLFTVQDEHAADGIISDLGADYVIIDMDTVTGKFWAVARYAGKDQSDYFGVYYVENDSQIAPVQFYYPEYYRSLAVRLFNFDGKAVAPQNVIAISWEGRVDVKGTPLNLVTNGMRFGTYEDAEAYVSNQNVGNWRIVSDNPFISPVPLEALEDYMLVYESGDAQTIGDAGSISEVKIFRHETKAKE